MKQLNKCVLFLSCYSSILLIYLQTLVIVVDGITVELLILECPYGYFWVLSQEDSLSCIFIKNGLENGFKDKELNKTGCMSIIATIVGLLVLVSMCSH